MGLIGNITKHINLEVYDLRMCFLKMWQNKKQHTMHNHEIESKRQQGGQKREN